MNAKNDIILELNRSIECYRVEAKNLRQEIYDNEQELSKKACEIFQLKDRVLLQHSSWQMLESSFKGEIAKLEAEVKALGVCLDGALALAQNLKTENAELVGRLFESNQFWIHSVYRNVVQRFVARIFRL